MNATEKYCAATELVDQRVRITIVGSGNVITVTLIAVAGLEAGIASWREGSVRRSSGTVLVYRYDDGETRAVPLGLMQSIEAVA